MPPPSLTTIILTLLIVMCVLVELLYRYVEMPCITFGKRLTAAKYKSTEAKQVEKANEQASV